MAKTATIVTATNGLFILAGEPIRDTDEGVLIIVFEDGTSRVFNWEHVIDYYEVSSSEYDDLVDEDGLGGF